MRTGHPARVTALLAMVGCVIWLAGCASQPPVKHHGYAADGYGIIDNSPHLPPPDHLMKAQPASP
ncbi:hypothetical protein [Acidomonas methanolica]|uniref:hypothetical protein n=1 Tax=Acidomonas methanolica TaxID=437 RepID=UPI00211A9040|nr:hypothetical protein [Acidomonas methanolica]MCQ9156008.1 hypothetical protein [Acidomonas methanolica]